MGVAIASYAVAVEVSPTVTGSIAAGAIGAGFLGLSSYDVYLAARYIKNAYRDLTGKQKSSKNSTL